MIVHLKRISGEIDQVSHAGTMCLCWENLPLQPDVYNGIPIYRVMDKDGSVIDPSQEPGYVCTLGTSDFDAQMSDIKI